LLLNNTAFLQLLITFESGVRSINSLTFYCAFSQTVIKV
jgi:hypothetical protein